MNNNHNPTTIQKLAAIGQLFLLALRLGLTSFGGPIAHLGYFRSEFVDHKKWLDDRNFADLVALCQLLPGPTSSQVGIAIGLMRASYLGGLAMWLGFTLPSTILLLLFAYSLIHFGVVNVGWLHGLNVVAVAVVAQAIWAMGKVSCPDKTRITLAIIGTLITSILPTAAGQIGAIIFGAIAGWLFIKSEPTLVKSTIKLSISKIIASIALLIFVVLLFLLPILAKHYHLQTLRVFADFFRVGSLVFGGGHVVLPLLQTIVVPNGMVSNDTFLAGYGAAQALPGPLFSFAAYLGAMANFPPSGLQGAIICLIAIYLPSFLLLIGVLPLWNQFHHHKLIQRAILGINAIVVGILLSALYNVLWVNTIFHISDFCLAITAFLLLNYWRMPAWLVVLLIALSGAIISSVKIY